MRFITRLGRFMEKRCNNLTTIEIIESLVITAMCVGDVPSDDAFIKGIILDMANRSRTGKEMDLDAEIPLTEVRS